MHFYQSSFIAIKLNSASGWICPFIFWNANPLQWCHRVPTGLRIGWWARWTRFCLFALWDPLMDYGFCLGVPCTFWICLSNGCSPRRRRNCFVVFIVFSSCSLVCFYLLAVYLFVCCSSQRCCLGRWGISLNLRFAPGSFAELVSCWWLVKVGLRCCCRLLNWCWKGWSHRNRLDSEYNSWNEIPILDAAVIAPYIGHGVYHPVAKMLTFYWCLFVIWFCSFNAAASRATDLQQMLFLGLCYFPGHSAHSLECREKCSSGACRGSWALYPLRRWVRWSLRLLQLFQNSSWEKLPASYFGNPRSRPTSCSS